MVKIVLVAWFVAMLALVTPAQADITSAYQTYTYCYNISNISSTRKTQLKQCVLNKASGQCTQRANNVDGYKGRAVYIKITAYGWVTGQEWKVYYSYKCELIRDGTAWSSAPRWDPNSII